MKKLLLLLMFVPLFVYADEANLSWTPPTEREDGTSFNPDIELGGFKIYSESFGQIGNDLPPEARSFSVPVDMMGQDICLTAFDIDGRESLCSNYETIPDNVMPPGSPNITVIFTIRGN